MSEIIRPLETGDHQNVLDIYNHYVLKTPITFDIEPATLLTRKDWFDSFATYPCFVACDGSDQLLGYACAAAFRCRFGWRLSAEVTIYLAPDFSGRGLGTRLYARLFEALEASHHRAYAEIALPNEASVALHLKFGFEPIGLMSEAGHKFNRFWDVACYEKKLKKLPE